MLKRKDLIGLIDLTKEELTEILDVASEMKAHLKAGEKNLSYLKGKTATILFYENSKPSSQFLEHVCVNLRVLLTLLLSRKLLKIN